MMLKTATIAAVLATACAQTPATTNAAPAATAAATTTADAPSTPLPTFPPGSIYNQGGAGFFNGMTTTGLFGTGAPQLYNGMTTLFGGWAPTAPTPTTEDGEPAAAAQPALFGRVFNGMNVNTNQLYGNANPLNSFGNLYTQPALFGNSYTQPALFGNSFLGASTPQPTNEDGSAATPATPALFGGLFGNTGLYANVAAPYNTGLFGNSGLYGNNLYGSSNLFGFGNGLQSSFQAGSPYTFPTSQVQVPQGPVPTSYGNLYGNRFGNAYTSAGLYGGSLYGGSLYGGLFGNAFGNTLSTPTPTNAAGTAATTAGTVGYPLQQPAFNNFNYGYNTAAYQTPYVGGYTGFQTPYTGYNTGYNYGSYAAPFNYNAYPSFGNAFSTFANTNVAQPATQQQGGR